MYNVNMNIHQSILSIIPEEELEKKKQFGHFRLPRTLLTREQCVNEQSPSSAPDVRLGEEGEGGRGG